MTRSRVVILVSPGTASRGFWKEQPSVREIVGSGSGGSRGWRVRRRREAECADGVVERGRKGVAGGGGRYGGHKGKWMNGDRDVSKAIGGGGSGWETRVGARCARPGGGRSCVALVVREVRGFALATSQYTGWCILRRKRYGIGREAVMVVCGHLSRCVHPASDSALRAPPWQRTRPQARGP